MTTFMSINGQQDTPEQISLHRASWDASDAYDAAVARAAAECRATRVALLAAWELATGKDITSPGINRVCVASTMGPVDVQENFRRADRVAWDVEENAIRAAQDEYALAMDRAYRGDSQ
jgi:hypothetical protein